MRSPICNSINLETKNEKEKLSDIQSQIEDESIPNKRTNIKKWDEGTMRELLYRLRNIHNITHVDIVNTINKMEQEYIMYDELTVTLKN